MAEPVNAVTICCGSPDHPRDCACKRLLPLVDALTSGDVKVAPQLESNALLDHWRRAEP